MGNRFENEVNLINDNYVKRLTIQCIEHAPSYFWEIPSSSTGKYHPIDENVPGGKYFHSQRFVRLAYDLCKDLNVSGRDRDFVIAASIMHDFCSNGYPTNSGSTIMGHGALWLNIVREFMPKEAITAEPEIKTIAWLIEEHMGIWDIPLTEPKDKLSMIVHLSDYVASREYIQVKL